MPLRRIEILAIALVCTFSAASQLQSKDIAQTEKNTLTLRESSPIEPFSFPKPYKFYIREVINRTPNVPASLVSRRDNGIFLRPDPDAIIRQRVENSLRSAALLADNASTADYFLTIQLVSFGDEAGIGREYFVKVEFNVVVESAQIKESKSVSALGTSVTFGKKNVQINLETALEKALRSFLRGAPFGDAVKSLEQSAQARRDAVAAAEAARKAAADVARLAAERAAKAEKVKPRTAEKPEEAPPLVEAGFVLVSSTLEGAEVYVDGGFVGNTPARVKLNPGKYTFRVVMAGEEDWIRELAVMPGSELKVFARHTAKEEPPKAMTPAAATDPKALSKADILNLLTNFVPNTRIIALVGQHGIKFKPSAADLGEIADAGGGFELLEAIRKAAKR